MGTRDKAANKTQDIKGKIKESVGKATGDKELQRKGELDQLKSAVKGVGEKVKDVKDAVTD